MSGPADAIVTDAVVVGAGPAGLFAAFELGLLEVGAHLVDALPEPGGQCVELYPDKPIYDIPGIVLCTGRELAARLLEQLRPIGTPMHLGQTVKSLARRDDGRFDLTTSEGLHFDAGAIVIASGAGAFSPRRLPLAGLDAYEGSQLRYRLGDPAAYAGCKVIVFGDDEKAIGAVLSLAEAESSQRPASVTLVHRRESFRAPAELLDRLAAARAAGRAGFIAAQATAAIERDGRIVGVELIDGEGKAVEHAADTLLVLLGLSPKLGPIADWGLDMERRQIRVEPARFETSVPGVHAIGDIVAYPGKKKLILCGFHEATLAAFAVAARCKPEALGPLEYTTTSTRLHRVLGIAPADRR